MGLVKAIAESIFGMHEVDGACYGYGWGPTPADFLNCERVVSIRWNSRYSHGFMPSEEEPMTADEVYHGVRGAPQASYRWDVRQRNMKEQVKMAEKNNDCFIVMYIYPASPPMPQQGGVTLETLRSFNSLGPGKAFDSEKYVEHRNVHMLVTATAAGIRHQNTLLEKMEACAVSQMDNLLQELTAQKEMLQCECKLKSNEVAQLKSKLERAAARKEKPTPEQQAILREANPPTIASDSSAPGGAKARGRRH